MDKPQFCQEGEEIENNEGLIVLPVDEPLEDDPSDKSHPNTKEKCIDPDTLLGVAKTFAQANWAWSKKKSSEDIEKDGFQFT